MIHKIFLIFLTMGLTIVPAFASNGIGDVFTSTESFSSPKNERVIILNEAFPEFRKLSHSCKFRSCTHTHEPSCAIKQALEEKQLWKVRYDNYLQFLSEIENRREIYKKTIKRK